MGEYVCGLMGSFSARYAPIESLAIDADGLYDPCGNRIDVLYRIFPLQLFRNELFQKRGTSIPPEMGGAVLRLVERRQLALINPPFAFLLEGKALQALIWNLSGSDIFFSEEERRLIAQYMLPIYLDPPTDDSAYVIKPTYGAEGDSVTMMAAGGMVMSQAMCTTYSDRPMVYQKHVELPAPEIMTEFGRRKLHVVTSCFLISGQPAGICMRAGDCITDDTAWVLPVCIGPADN
jgi:glutathionylspermidine synthase